MSEVVGGGEGEEGMKEDVLADKHVSFSGIRCQ